MMPLKNLVDGNRAEGSSFGIPSHFANDFCIFLESGAGVSLPEFQLSWPKKALPNHCPPAAHVTNGSLGSDFQ